MARHRRIQPVGTLEDASACRQRYSIASVRPTAGRRNPSRNDARSDRAQPPRCPRSVGASGLAPFTLSGHAEPHRDGRAGEKHSSGTGHEQGIRCPNLSDIRVRPEPSQSSDPVSSRDSGWYVTRTSRTR